MKRERRNLKMKNKEFTKVYEGLQSLIRVAMGDSVYA